MSNREVSSLDRFVVTRGPVLAGIVDDSRPLLVMGILAAVYAILGYGFAGAGFLATAAPAGSAALPMAISGGIFLATGGLLGGIRLWLKSHLKPEHTTRAEVTAEARELLCALIGHVQGQTFGRRSRHRLRRAMQRGLTDPKRSQRCEDLLAPETFRLLESAACQYNRIYGLVGPGAQPGGDAFERFAPEVLAAADATMAQLLDTGAMVNRLPETAPRLEAEVRGRVEELTELAGEVERLRGASMTSPGLAEGASPVRRVLEELRADERAREELRLSRTEPAQQRNELRLEAAE